MGSPQPAEIGKAIRAQQKASRERLAREASDLAKRLNVAYQRVIDAMKNDVQLAEKIPNSLTLQTMQEKFQQALDDFKPALEKAARAAQDGGIREGRAAGIGALRIDPAIDSFGSPLIETIQAGADFVDSAAWQADFARYGEAHAQRLADIALGSLANGENPNKTARRLKAYIAGQGGMPGYPLTDAIRNARTVQVYSARSGTLAVYRANADTVRGWIWSASLDDRVCLSCLAMHGTRHTLAETLNDHHSGRCAMVPITPSWSELGFTGGGEVDPGVNGETWFRALPPAKQRQRMGKARWQAWKDGLFTFDQLSETYQDDVYGDMRTEASLVSLIGEGAARQYRSARE